MKHAIAALAIVGAAVACTRAVDSRQPVTTLVLASPPPSAVQEVQIVAEDGEDPALAAWGSHASFEDVARATEADAGNGPELSFDALLEPLSDETLMTLCGENEGTHVRARVAILRGRAIGVTVESEPEDPELEHCLDRHIRALAWESSDRVHYVVKTW